MSTSQMGKRVKLTEIGKYKIRRRLISTRLSTVYIADDPDLEVIVAIKVYDPAPDKLSEWSDKVAATWRTRFMEEPKILATLDHPHIVAVKEMSYLEDGRPFFVMPFVDANLPYEIGMDEVDEKKIAKMLDKEKPRRLTVWRASQILFQTLSALSVLHERGLVHRDLKPGNILLTKLKGGDVKLIDFGCVKNPENNISLRGRWIGSKDYMPPEQHKDAGKTDARADVYAMGVTAYRMLAGKLPLDDPEPLSSLNEEVSPALEALIMRCMRSNKNKRPKNAMEMARLLQDALNEVTNSQGF